MSIQALYIASTRVPAAEAKLAADILPQPVA